jgi:ubiquinol-cytochrome c reductase cytochrome c1 subunit
MIKSKNICAAFVMAIAIAGMGALPAVAQDTAAEPTIAKQAWTFGGLFGTYDKNQLQRGFQVFKEVCSSCHSANLLAFRNLSEEGGPNFSEAQVKALAATYKIPDPTLPDGERTAVPADHWPNPFVSEQDARNANGGIVPPDFSVLAKARGIEEPFPWWVLDYFTVYQEGGPDYIHALLTSFRPNPPAGFQLPAGKFYNDVYPGHAIGMPPPLTDGLVAYTVAEGQQPVPLTMDQYSKDVSAFMMWLAEPGLDARKEAGFRVLLFLVVFAGLMFMVKRRVWSKVEGH